MHHSNNRNSSPFYRNAKLPSNFRSTRLYYFQSFSALRALAKSLKYRTNTHAHELRLQSSIFLHNFCHIKFVGRNNRCISTDEGFVASFGSEIKIPAASYRALSAFARFSWLNSFYRPKGRGIKPLAIKF